MGFYGGHMSILIKDIAKKIGVSNATVSNALNNRKGVSEIKKREIVEVATEMGYFKKTNIGEKRIEFLIIANNKSVVNDSAFFSELIKGLEKESYQNETELIVRHINLVDLEKVMSLENLNDKTNGYILLATEIQESDLDFLSNFKLPLVILDASFKNPNFTYVGINNRDGAYNATKFILDRNYESIGIITSVEKIENFDEREVGFNDALRSKFPRSELESICRLEVNPTLEGSYNDMKKHLENDLIPSESYFVVNDTIAYGVRKALDESGYQSKVALIGFDDIPIASMMTPPLTTVKVEKSSLGKLAVQQINEQIDDDNYVKIKIEVNTSLVIRGSVKKK